MTSGKVIIVCYDLILSKAMWSKKPNNSTYSMASKLPVCRVCNTSTSTSTSTEAATTRRCRQLFGNMGIKDQLPGRLSVELDLRVQTPDLVNHERRKGETTRTTLVRGALVLPSL